MCFTSVLSTVFSASVRLLSSSPSGIPNFLGLGVKRNQEEFGKVRTELEILAQEIITPEMSV